MRNHPPLDRFAAAVDERALVRPVDADLFGAIQVPCSSVMVSLFGARP
jgi:hypothetical protein